MKIAVAVFAKVPVPGRVKTRLQPALGADRACALYRAMLHDTLDKLAQTSFAVELWVAGGMGPRRGLPTFAQRGSDLGERMAGAFAAMLGRADAALIVGSDVPTLPLRCLHAAAAHLRRGDAVLGPASDGGYYLIGAREVPSFEAVRWSTCHALADTERTLRARRIEPWYDVDRPDDLRLLHAHLSLQPSDAPHTTRVLGLPSSTHAGPRVPFSVAGKATRPIAAGSGWPISIS